MVYAAQDSQSY